MVPLYMIFSMLEFMKDEFFYKFVMFLFKKLDDLFAARWHKDPSGGNRWGRNKTVPNGEYSRSTIISRNREIFNSQISHLNLHFGDAIGRNC